MTIPAWPTGLRTPSSVAFGPSANTQSGGVSPFDRSEQTLLLPGGRWRADLHWNNLVPAEHRPLLGWLASLGGRAGRFTWAPPASLFPRLGDAPANGAETRRVRTAGQSGSSIDTTGWDVGTWAVRRGDLFGWLNPAGRPQLHMATADTAPTDPTSTNLQFYGAAIASGVSAGAFTVGATATNLGAVADPASGTGALRMGNTVTGSGYLVSTKSVSASTVYSLGVDLRRNSGTGTSGSVLTVDEWNGSVATRTAGLAISGLPLGSSWARVTRSLVTRSDTVSLIMYWLANWNSGDQWDVFGCQLEQRATPTARIATSGAATATRVQSLVIPVSPPLRAAPNANEPLVLASAPAVWRLSSDDVLPDYAPGGFCNLSIQIEEALFG